MNLITERIGRRYKPLEFESKWEKIWEEKKTFKVDIEKAKKPFYNLAMFPYPSGEGLHVGHIIPYSGADTFGRFMRMKGFDVFEPMGFDAFGIHAENFAIKKGIHPAKLTAQTTKYFRDEQMKKLGTLFDWERMVDTSSPNYYKWTQWLFIKMFKAGLAVRKKAMVNWCPSCKTVLSDEQVVKGTRNTANVTRNEALIDVCERCGILVERREMEQWFFKITNYAERLLENTYKIDWSRKTLAAQRNWIGKSEGAVIKFPIKDVILESEAIPESKNVLDPGQARMTKDIEVFTTRPDTLGGATFVVISPEHGLVKEIIQRHSERSEESENDRDPSPDLIPYRVNGIRMTDYVEKAKNKSEQERMAEGREKTGVFSGLYAINPLTNEEIPIWIADYAVMGYGSGAIMGVPASDIRDFEFAKKFNLPIIRVIVGEDGKTGEITSKADVCEEGTLINSDFLNGLERHEAAEKMRKYMEEKGWGKRKTHYKLRDWCISRQRYWGPPIPMIHCPHCSNNHITYFDYLVKQEEAKGNPSTSLRTRVQSAKPKCKDQNEKMSLRSGSAGEAIPLNKGLFENMAGWFPADEEDLPVKLPETNDYLPDGSGKSPLAKIPSFVKTKCPYCGGEADRETDVSDTFLDSSWYFLRYPSVGEDVKIRHSGERSDSRIKITDDSGRASQSEACQNDELLPFNPEITKKWLPVDMYIGGNEHAVLHLMYARFVTMALYDMGYLSFEEPFTRFFAHGLLIKDGAKMSKSRGNVVNPNVYLNKYGADVLRMYILFLGPYDGGGDFRDTGIEGMWRFLNRVYRWGINVILGSSAKQDDSRINNRFWTSLPVGRQARMTDNIELWRSMQKLIKGVGEDLGNLKFNTAIAKMMEYLNEFSIYNFQFSNSKSQKLSLRDGSDATDEAIPSKRIEILKNYILLLAPLAPHLSEELYQELRGARGESGFESVHDEPWPSFDEKALVTETVTIIIQVNGKVRGKMAVPSKDLEVKNAEEKIIIMAKQEEKVKKYLEGKKIVKTVYVPFKLVNFAV